MYCSLYRARTRRHSSVPSISGMDQSDTTMGICTVWSRVHASFPSGATVTAYPSPLRAALRCRRVTGSSSAIRTCTCGCALEVLQDGLHLTREPREVAPGAFHGAIACRSFHLLK